jgi:hypothetical protein
VWWVEQTLNERKTHFDFKHTGLGSYKNYVWRQTAKLCLAELCLAFGAKLAAGMKMYVTPNRSKQK